MSTEPLLPLILWRTPGPVEQMLRQEGVPIVLADDEAAFRTSAGRFVIHDGGCTRDERRLVAMLRPGQVSIDIDRCRGGVLFDPFAAWLDTSTRLKTWRIGAAILTERVARYEKAALRRRVVDTIRYDVLAAGGVWIRQAPWAVGMRGVFHFRADLDEPFPEDVRRFLDAVEPVGDALTVFVSTRAYGTDVATLGRLRPYDVQSHGHHHVAYRRPDANHRNLARAAAVLREHGFDPDGFAAPESRWSPHVDHAAEAVGARFGSEFSLAYDDRPFFPARRDGRSPILQIPVHPLCEGLWPEASDRAECVGMHLRRVVEARLDAGEPAFVYGHPERRLGRMPHAIRPLVESVTGRPRLWRVTMREYAAWWRRRIGLAWTVRMTDPGRFIAEVARSSSVFEAALEVVRADGSVAVVDPQGERAVIDLAALRFETRRAEPPLPPPVDSSAERGLKTALKRLLDWETVTPVEELAADTPLKALKRELRRRRAAQAERVV